MEDWKGKLVVITGATSGLGRAAALEFARRGFSLVLAARRREALADLVATCGQLGANAVPCQVDITQEGEVRRLLETALSVDGRIDVWVNNAGVTLFAKLDEAPFEEHRRVIETNVLGTMLCARAVLPVFRSQGYGVLVNVASVLGKVGQPFVPSYVISKFAIRGLSEALRADVAEMPHVHVCTLLPYAIDTQHFEAAANYTGNRAHPMQPVQAPEVVAKALVNLAMKPERERHVPRWIALGYVARTLFPRFSERLLVRLLERWHLSPRLQAPTSGNLFRPEDKPSSVHGHRPPLVSTAGLVVGAAREAVALAVRMSTETVRRWWRLGVRLPVALLADGLSVVWNKAAAQQKLLPSQRKVG